MAFGNEYGGPFVRLERPLISYESICDDSSQESWGVGQPSATSIDGQGRLLLFGRVECRGHAVTVRWEVDLSNVVSTVAPPLGPAVPLPFDGLTKGEPLLGEPDASLNSASFAYDATRDAIFVVRHQHPLPEKGDTPDYIPVSVEVARIDASAVWSGVGRWTPLGAISQWSGGGNTFGTGWARNNNAGILRDPHGNLVDPSVLEIANSVGTRDAFPAYHWQRRNFAVLAELH